MAAPNPITWVQRDTGVRQPRHGTGALLSHASNGPGKDTPVSHQQGCPLHQEEVASEPWFGDQLRVPRPPDTHMDTEGRAPYPGK